MPTRGGRYLAVDTRNGRVVRNYRTEARGTKPRAQFKPACCKANSAQLRQVVMNLVNNATDAIGEESRDSGMFADCVCGIVDQIYNDLPEVGRGWPLRRADLH